MASSRVSCLMSKNEEFALKKNIGEDAKLRNKIESLSIEKTGKSEEIYNDIKSLRQTLKDIRTSTGNSPDGIRTLSIRADANVSEYNNIMYNISDKMRIRSVSVKSEFSRRRSVWAEVNNHINDVTSSSGYQEQIAAETRNELVPPKALHFDQKSGNLFAKGLDNYPRNGFYLTTPSNPMVKQTNSNNSSEKEKLSSVFNEETGSSEDETKDQAEALAEYIRKLYNPWNIQNRNGKEYDALQLPKIKDCYRPACRSTCSTCLIRKKKTPCFLIPGLIDIDKRKLSPDTFNMFHTGISSKKKKRKKELAKIANSDVIDSSDERNISCVDVDHDNGSSAKEDPDQELNELLNTKPEPERKISYARLKQLAMPKGGYRRELRFSKTFLRRSIDKMVRGRPIQEMTEMEKENLRKIESRISMFLAYNLQSEDIRPNKMVDIPVREDIMNVDISCISSYPHSITQIPIPKLPRRVYFK